MWRPDRQANKTARQAFYLTTTQKAYVDDPIPGDIGGPGGSLTPDGAVNLNDLAIMAANWLVSAP